MTQVPPRQDAPIKEWAIYYHSLGLHPLPVRPGTKFPAVKWAEYQTRQPTLAEIESWDWSGGVGIVTTGLVVVDCDKGGEVLLRGKDFPPSWTVRTGGDGLNRYFRTNGQALRNKVRILQGENGAGVDIRADGGFTVMPPSLHKDTGRPYRWLLPPDTVPLAPVPDWIVEAATQREVQGQPNNSHLGSRDAGVIARARAYLAKVPPAIEGQGGDTHTLSTACKIVRGFDLDAETAVDLLIEWNAGCQPPWTEREIRQKVANALKYGTEPIGHLRDTERPHFEQRASARVEPQEEACIEELPAEAPETDSLIFPEVAYQGLAAEIADAYAKCLEAPREFFYMDALTILGAMLSTRVRLESQLFEEPRLYTVKVAPSWSGRKSSSQENMERQHEPLLADRVTMCHGVGSAEGLARRMQSGLPTLLVYDEFRSFVDKAGVQQSVLLPMVSMLFHRTVYENSIKERDWRLTDAHLSLIGSCTTETFTTMFTPTFRNIGLINRLFVVTGKRTTLKPIPEAVPYETVKRLRDRTLKQIQKVEQRPLALRFAPDAQRRWEEWYRAMPETPYAARLDTYGFRMLMLYAVTTETWQITRPLVDAVVPLLDYELAVRRELDPVDAEGIIARMERLILKHLCKGRMPESRLQALCNVRHYGVWVFEQALRNIDRQQWLGVKKAGRGRHLWLTEAGYEAAKQ